MDGIGGAKVPSFHAVICFLLIWTAVSVPLGLLLGAMIRFGARDGLPSDQIDRKLGTPSLVRQRDPVGAEERTILIFRNTNARQSRESVSGSGASADQGVGTTIGELAQGQVGLLSPDSERGDGFGTPKKQSS